jgi:hypothetical protein
MLNHTRLWILCVACAQLPSCAAPREFPRRQDLPRRTYVFSGAVMQADCEKLPALSFNIRPSMDRADTQDSLTVQCVPKKDHSATLNLIFTITQQAPSTPDRYERRYSFRWGQWKESRGGTSLEQFNRKGEQCKALTDLFKAKVSTTISSTSEHLRQSPQWSVGCWDDAMWGTSMEMYLTGKFHESL